MKSLMFILFPILVFAQTPYPDTLFTTDGKFYPCLITGINESKIELIYSQNINESIIIKAVKKISLEEMGIVYLNENGFTIPLKKIKVYIENRKKKLDEEQTIKEEQEKLSAFTNAERPELINFQMPGHHTNKNSEINRWSFGILYIPYFSGRIYNVYNSTSYPPYYYYYPEVYSMAINETNMEAQIAYAVMEDVRFTLDVSYTSTSTERRSEYHRRDNDPQYGYNYDSGYLIKDELTLFDFTLGIKYYFKNIINEKVNIYALAGIGKQFAIAEYEYEELFIDPPQVIFSEDNRKEFLEDSNSPFHFNIGFGAEYFFNESLSLTSNIRFIYSKIKAKYDSRTISETSTYTNSVDFKHSDFLTRVGLGLNFYF